MFPATVTLPRSHSITANPAERRRHHIRDQFDRSQNEGMRRVYRIALHGHIGSAGKDTAGAQRGGRLVRRVSHTNLACTDMPSLNPF